MAIEAALSDLRAQAQALHEALVSLRTTVVEDHPLSGGNVLVDLYGDSVDDLLGRLAEARAAIEGAAAEPGHLGRLGEALGLVHTRAGEVRHSLTGDLARYERVAELIQFGRRRGGEWWVWSESVRAALDDCSEPCQQLDQALARCWRDLAERADALAMAIRAQPIGPGPRLVERERLSRSWAEEETTHE